MTLEEAKKIIENYSFNYRLLNEKMKMVIEAFDLTIQKYNNPMHINELGAI